MSLSPYRFQLLGGLSITRTCVSNDQASVAILTNFVWSHPKYFPLDIVTIKKVLKNQNENCSKYHSIYLLFKSISTNKLPYWILRPIRKCYLKEKIAKVAVLTPLQFFPGKNLVFLALNYKTPCNSFILSDYSFPTKSERGI